MKTAIKSGLVALALVAGFTAANAAPRTHVQRHDPWVQQLHLDNDAVGAKQYFEEMQRDGH